MPNSQRTLKILSILKKIYPDANCALHYKNPLQLLVATILAAQCTDERVNQVTPALFKKYKTAGDFAAASWPTLEQEIHSTGFYRQKARSIQNSCKILVEKFRGQVPRTLEELVTLPSVWRKTANVVLGNCYGVPGIVVDTHVRRLAFRLGFTRYTDPDKIEQDVMRLFPKKDWGFVSHALTWHGRKICHARKPACSICPLLKFCPRKGVTVSS